MMKKPIHSVWYSLSIFFMMLSIVSCKKNSAEPNDGSEIYTIGFKFKEFERHVSPLEAKLQATSETKKRASSSFSKSGVHEGLIYYWSFNAGTLMPDIYTSTHWSITYNQGLIPDEYGIGWGYDTYTAGNALSLKGLQELIFKMPLTNVIEMHELAFDVSSSGTGPKGFSLLFSQDGENYVPLKENNQFTNTNTPQARNTFSFSLRDLSLDYAKELFIKLVPKPGIRGNAGDYNATKGIMRMDNFRISGTSAEIGDANVRRIHYHVFDAVTKNLVLSGADHFREGELTDFSLVLPAGSYIASFVANVSNAELHIPEIGSASAYYVSNSFANHKANIFGVLDTFSVDGNTERELELKRYYSEVRFAFTDIRDLSNVAKLVVKQVHQPKFYAPFQPAMNNPVLDDSEIVIPTEFTADNREVFFHQFMGNIMVPTSLMYEVEAYDVSDGLITRLRLDAEVVNNVRLLFRGKLLETPGSGFVVRLNEDWDGEKNVDFN